jgi:hypothetical protein
MGKNSFFQHISKTVLLTAKKFIPKDAPKNGLSFKLLPIEIEKVVWELFRKK